MSVADDKLLKYEALIELVRTTEDVVKLDEEIGLLVQSLYQVEGDKFEQVLQKYVRIRVAMEITKIIQSHQVSQRDDIKLLLSNAYRTICALPVLRLTLAFEPSEMIINELSRWARINLEPGILLDLSLDRNLLGGAVVAYQGKFFDYSLRNRLNEIFEGDLRLE